MDKRVFFGFEAIAPWPIPPYPSGRLIAQHDRHITIAFLGSVDSSLLENLLPHLPKPDFEIGLAALMDKIIFLPSRHPHVVASRVTFNDEDNKTLRAFHNQLNDYLISNELLKEKDKKQFFFTCHY